MNPIEEKLKEIRRDYSTLALGLDDQAIFNLVLKEINRSRFFLQEAIDSLSEEEQANVGLEHTNLLLELTRASLPSVFAEQRQVLSKLIALIEQDLLLPDHREIMTQHLLSYTESLARLHGLTSAYKMAELFTQG